MKINIHETSIGTRIKEQQKSVKSVQKHLDIKRIILKVKGPEGDIKVSKIKINEADIGLQVIQDATVTKKYSTVKKVRLNILGTQGIQGVQGLPGKDGKSYKIQTF